MKCWKKDYKGKLKCITLDNSFKKEIIEQLIVAFEQNKIEIDNDQSLINELQGFTVTYNPASQTGKIWSSNWWVWRPGDNL